MKKIYTRPTVSVTVVKNTDVITLSGLTFGGDKGQSEKESFSSLFGAAE
ncbi:MAG: hypothetical protein IJR59_05035 [Firmicutes bacterium]|nr:hypothetical protein [Bacillota bacterium]